MSFRNSTLALTLAVAGACFAGSVAHAAGSVGEQCSAFIETGRPGVNSPSPTAPSIAAWRKPGKRLSTAAA